MLAAKEPIAAGPRTTCPAGAGLAGVLAFERSLSRVHPSPQNVFDRQHSDEMICRRINYRHIIVGAMRKCLLDDSHRVIANNASRAFVHDRRDGQRRPLFRWNQAQRLHRFHPQKGATLRYDRKLIKGVLQYGAVMKTSQRFVGRRDHDTQRHPVAAGHRRKLSFVRNGSGFVAAICEGVPCCADCVDRNLGRVFVFASQPISLFEEPASCFARRPETRRVLSGARLGVHRSVAETLDRFRPALQ